MKAKIGSARIGETGSARNNTAGDQTGKEVSIQDWYLHSKGWRVFRCIAPSKAEKIAEAMKMACDNNLIGYDQADRLSLYNEVKDKGFNPSLASKQVETDCSALVRVCLLYAGIDVPNFTTTTEGKVLMDTGIFTEYLSSEYTKSDKKLKPGDILVTTTTGHTVICVEGGSDTIQSECPYKEPILTIKKGSKGEGAKWVQWYLCKNGFKVSIDGSFGPDSYSKLIAFQQKMWPTEPKMIDGKCGPKTRAALKA